LVASHVEVGAEVFGALAHPTETVAVQHRRLSIGVETALVVNHLNGSRVSWPVTRTRMRSAAAAWQQALVSASPMIRSTSVPRRPKDSLGRSASFWRVGQISIVLEGHLAARHRLAGERDELAEGVRKGTFAVLFEAQVIDCGANLEADLLQDGGDLVVAAGGVQDGHDQRAA
jgi:hypothetical protein